MPIVTLQPDATPPIKVTAPVPVEPPSASIFSSLVPESSVVSLLKYIEGYPWTVNFYGQLLNIENTLEHFDPSTPNLTQPYYEVNKLILQVQSPLTSNYDQATGVTKINGDAIMPHGITPNVGDVFIASVDTGEDAIFHITSVNRKTYRKNTVYEISYSLYQYASANPTFVETLKGRVQSTFYFNPDAGLHSRDILVKPSVKEAIDRLNVFLTQSMDYYFGTFPQKITGSIVIPGVDNTLYDSHLVSFISKIVPYEILADIPFYRHSIVSEHINNQPSILTALVERSMAKLNVANRTYAFLPTYMTANKARLGTAFHAGVDYILSPLNPNTNTQIRGESVFNRSLHLSEMRTQKNYASGTGPIIIKTTNNNDVYDTDLLHDLFRDDFYVVSENFYAYLTDKDTYANLSYIELLIYRFMNGEAIAKEDLAVAVEKYNEWPLLHQLYLLPVFWLLVKVNLA